jgi:hypothetical protein
MATASVAPAVLCQLVATLQLVETLSPSLSVGEVMDIRCILLRVHDYMGAVLEERDLGIEAMTFAREFDGCSPDFLLNFFRRS